MEKRAVKRERFAKAEKLRAQSEQFMPLFKTKDGASVLAAPADPPNSVSESQRPVLELRAPDHPIIRPK